MLCSTSKAHPGRIFLLLSPAERAAMSSTNQPKSPGKDSRSSLEESATSSGTLSEASTQVAWLPQPDTVYGAGADVAPAGQQLNASDAEQTTISTPFSSFCIDEDSCNFHSSSGERSTALREQLRSMHPFTSDCVPETATTAPIISISERALLEERFMQKSLSADTDSVPHGATNLREQLRAALVPCLAASACGAVNPNSVLTAAPGDCCSAEGSSADQQDASAAEANRAEQPLNSTLLSAPSPASADPDFVSFLESKADEEAPADQTGSLSFAVYGVSTSGSEKEQASGGEAAAKAEVVESLSAPDHLAGSSPREPRAVPRTSSEDLRQAQAALASFPGHLTESQATAVADVRSRMRDLAQESTAKVDASATASASSAFGAAFSGAGAPSGFESACGTIQRLSVVIGERRFRSASACPADYSTPGKLPFESAGSLSLPDDTFRSAFDAACDPDGADIGAEFQLLTRGADMHEEDELVTYRQRLPTIDWFVPARNRTADGQAPAAQDGMLRKQAAAFESHQLPMRDSAFDSQRSNSSAAAGYAEDPPLSRSSSDTSKDGTRRQAPHPSASSWKPWIVSAAIVASCSLVLPSATILCMVAASLVFILAGSPATSTPARLPSGTEGRTSIVACGALCTRECISDTV